MDAYLKSGYKEEDAQYELTVLGSTYKVLKREAVTAFYDADGNTLFDVVNERLEKEYEWLMNDNTKEDTEITNTEESKKNAAEEVDKDTEKENGNPEVSAPVEEAPADQPEADGEILGGIEDAVTKLQQELEKASDKSFAEPVISYLIERVRESENLAKDILQKHKTWNKCYKYIWDQARKSTKENSMAVRDSVVYEWAEDYYHLDDKAIEEKKAREAAERKKKEEERKQKEKAKKPRKLLLHLSSRRKPLHRGRNQSRIINPKRTRWTVRWICSL